MSKVNQLIKKYAKTDDYGQYAKKEALWDEIKECKEIKEFMGLDDSKLIIEKYKTESDKNKSSKNGKEIDFEFLLKTTKIFDYGEDFFTELESKNKIDAIESRRIEKIRYCIRKIEDIDIDALVNTDKLINKLRSENKKEIENLLSDFSNKSQFEPTLNYIIGVLNHCIDNNKNIVSEFNKIKEIANLRGIKYAAVYGTIGSSNT